MTIEELQNAVVEFRDKRNWKQFHKPKDLAMDLSVEAAEVLEHFLWENEKALEEYFKKNKNKKAVGEEIADVLHVVLLLASELNIDIPKAFMAKMRKNENKYPIKKSKGSNKKYTEL